MAQIVGALQGAGLAVAGRAAARWADWLAAERGRFALWLPVFMGAGDLAYFTLRAEPPGWAGIGLLLPAVAGALLARPWRLLRAALAAMAAAALGFTAAQFAAARAPPLLILPNHAAVASGTVDALESLPEGRRVTLRRATIGADASALPRTLRIRLRNDDASQIETGDLVQLRAMVRAPSPPAYPGGWDVQRDAFFNGIGGYGFALGGVEPLAHAPPGNISARLHALRAAIAARVAAALPGPQGAIATTLLTGLTAGIPEADRAAFRDSGLAHLLAIAGLHIGIVMGLFFGGSRLLLACWEWAALHWPIKQIAAFAALAAGGFYMLLTGMHVPIVRSFAMACLVTLGLLAGRRAISLRGLGLAGVALILLEPEQITGVSFQMSFSAVLALIAGYAALRPWLRRFYADHRPWRRFLLYAAGLALTSLLAGGASAPFAAYHFGRVQIYFVIANMIAVPLTALWVMPAGLIALALMPFGLERLALVPMAWGVRGLLAIAHAVASWPDATLPVPHMPPWGLALLALGMAWLGLWRSRVRLAGIAAIGAALASPLLVRPPDLLVSADARLIAVRTTHGVFADAASGTSRFVQQSWQQYWARGPMRPLNVGPRTAPEEIVCNPTACVLRARPGGPPALLLLTRPDQGAHGDHAGRRSVATKAHRDEPEPEGCVDAVVVVSAEPARGRCFGPPLVDRFTVWRNGAYAVWLDPGVATLLSDREERGTRPWVPPPPQPRRRNTEPRGAEEAGRE